LHELAGENSCSKIATGHTRDDQAETVLLRLVRGGGPRGLSAILPTRSDGVIRPLLECRRSEVETVVRTLGLEYRIDDSNLNPQFLRTHVRHRVLPLLSELNPSIVHSLARIAELQRTQSEILASWTSGELVRVAPDNAIDVVALRVLPAGWASYVVRSWLEQASASSRQLAAVHVAAVLDLASSARRSGRLTLPGGLRVRRRGDFLLLGEGPSSLPDEPRLLKPGDELRLPGGWRLSAMVVERESMGASLPSDLWTAVCARQDAGSELRVRMARRGERVQPLGMRGRKKLSDLFIDHKVPLEERANYPVIDHAGSIIWVPGVVRAEVLCVDASTRHILRLRAERDD
jgi:tRNA(Ile)-lysidine synthase